MRSNLRREERVRATLPVDLGLKGASATTRDISATGMSFDTDASLAVGTKIQFKVDLVGPDGNLTLECTGKIVRSEPLDGRVRVAVKMTESAMVRA